MLDSIFSFPISAVIGSELKWWNSIIFLFPRWGVVGVGGGGGWVTWSGEETTSQFKTVGKWDLWERAALIGPSYLKDSPWLVVCQSFANRAQWLTNRATCFSCGFLLPPSIGIISNCPSMPGILDILGILGILGNSMWHWSITPIAIKSPDWKMPSVCYLLLVLLRQGNDRMQMRSPRLPDK